MTMIKCPTQDRLKSFYRGEIPDEQSDELVTHLTECSDCQASLNQSDDGHDWLIAQLRKADEDSQLDREAACQLGILKALGAFAITDALEANRVDEARVNRDFPDAIGDYQILRILGTGGMGRVYLARHGKLGKLVAVKVLASHRLADHRALQRFESEMRAIGRLSHPNIVTAHDARDIDGKAVLVTEYIDGMDLGQLISRTGPLPIAEACEIIRKVSEALVYTNEQGFVHRDIKPSNIMLSQSGDVKLLDLGLARLPAGEEERAEVTGTGQTMGTADYISPEQITDSRQVDVRSDIYSLGATFYKLLSGRAPFADEAHLSAFAKMTAHVSKSPTPIQALRRDLPIELVRMIESMLQKRPDNRPHSPRLIAESLSDWCSQADLKRLIEQAQLVDPQSVLPTVETKSIANGLSVQPVLKYRSSNSKTIAAGFFGFLAGIALGIIITITNPDGTRSVLNLPDGTKFTVSQSPTAPSSGLRNEQDRQSTTFDSVNGGGRGPRREAASRFDPLQFVLLINPESSGKKPSIADHELQVLLEQLHRTNSGTLVGSRESMFIPIANESTGEVPISAWNNGIRFALVSTERKYAIPWSDIKGKLLSVERILDSRRSETQLQLEFAEELGKKLEALTSAAIGQSLGIIADGKLIQAPLLNSSIKNSAVITGRFPEHVLNMMQDNFGDATQFAPSSGTINSVTVPAESVTVENHSIALLPFLEELQPLLTEARPMKLEATTLERLANRLVAGFGFPQQSQLDASNAMNAVWPLSSIKKGNKGVRPEMNWIATDPSKCVTFEVDPTLLYADLIKFAQGWNGSQAVIKEILNGFEKDPQGPQIKLERDLFARFGSEIVIEPTVPLIAIQLSEVEPVRSIVSRNIFDGNLQVVGDYLLLGTRRTLGAARQRFGMNAQLRK